MDKTISILGSTGSIGTQCIDIVRRYGFRVKALTANKNTSLLASQAKELCPDVVCICDAKREAELRELLRGTNIKVLSGEDGLLEIASLDGVDMVVNSLVGMVGLKPTLAAIEKGTDLALANKETLVTGGKLVIEGARKKGVKILPVDSEHSAIFQCLQGAHGNKLKKIILTASGGPFFGKTAAELENATIADALNHPNWSMGNKITVDSATLMNKGLEFIEAMWLFDLRPDQIEIVVQRESIIHSAVEFEDNSVIAQLGVPDMKIPIQYALTYPERKPCDVKPLSLTDLGAIHFAKPDFKTFECLTSCIDAVTRGGILPAVANGANEAAVSMFLDGRIGFLDIGRAVRGAVLAADNRPADSLQAILEADRQARDFAANLFCKEN